jgi:DNA-binding response OmpR family regulator
MHKNAEKTVLIIEKQANYTQLLVKQVMFAGLNPIVAVTGAGGLRKVEECRPDLILLELELTDMDGLDFVLSVRRKPEADHIPIVAMSTFSHMKAKALQNGCNEFLLKPVKMIQLMGHVRKFLREEMNSGSV